MKRVFTIAATLGLVCAAPVAVQAGPQQDLKEFRSYYAKRFPDTPFKDYVNGVYSIDQASREQWEAIEEFPPYELNIEKGKELFRKPFKNGKTYASCFRNGGIAIKQDYPYFDSASGKVVTLESAINDCRTKNGEQVVAGVGSFPMYTCTR